MRVRVLKSRLIGSTVQEEGDEIDLHDDIARRLIQSGDIEKATAIGFAAEIETADAPSVVEETAELPKRKRK